MSIGLSDEPTVVERFYMWYGNSYLREKAVWELRFCWLPKKCYQSKKLIWLTYAYCGTITITGPGDPVIIHHWHEKCEHLIWLLKA